MSMPFPGMDPYLEHPTLWAGVHSRLINVLSQQLGPLLRPRYITSIEERVFIETPEQQRIPDVWVQQVQEAEQSGGGQVAVATDLATPVLLQVPELEVKQHYLEILDRYQNMRVVTVIEVVSPSNKIAGPGREAYQQKQQATLASDCHLVEIDLLRQGQSVLNVPSWQLSSLGTYDYLMSVNRWPQRTQYELYPVALRERLPRFGLPLVEPDADVPLDIQSALDQVYEDGSYMLRVKYDEPCEPSLDPDDQQWATECWTAYRQAHPEMFSQPSE